LRPVVEHVVDGWATCCWRAVGNHTQQVLQTAHHLPTFSVLLVTSATHQQHSCNDNEHTVHDRQSTHSSSASIFFDKLILTQRSYMTDRNTHTHTQQYTVSQKRVPLLFLQ